MFLDENYLATRENLIRYFTRYLGMVLSKVNPAIRFVQIETPVLLPNEKGAATVLRTSTSPGAYEVARQLLDTQAGSKFKLPLVVWQHGRIFKPQRRQPRELYVLEYQFLFSKTTGVKYQPTVLRCCESMLRKQCGKIFTADEDANGVSIFDHDADLELVNIHERADFSGGKNIEIAFDLDSCTKVNFQYEFGKIRRAPPVDKSRCTW